MPVISTALVFFVLAAGFALLSRNHSRISPAGWDSVQLARYSPLPRLLDEKDFAFLRSQPGISAARLRAFRRTRYALFQQFLRELSAEFRVLHHTAATLISRHPGLDPEFASQLLVCRLSFESQLAVLQMQLFLTYAGFRVPATVDPLREFREMHRKTAQLVAASA